MEYVKTNLLIFQSTSFCNIYCTYCYLPDRHKKKKISLDTVKITMDRLKSENLINNDLSVLWHSGEPLVLSPDFYNEAFNLIENYNSSDCRIRHSIQTNAMLVDEKFCRIFQKHNATIGVSIDGPKFIHDKYRVKRNGSGSFDKAIKGIKLLQKYDLDIRVISVLTEYSLNYPQEIFDFFVSEGLNKIAFNIEEIEGVNSHSSLEVNFDASKEKFIKFMNKIYELNKANNFPLKIREFSTFERRFLAGVYIDENKIPVNGNVTPFSMLSIDADGGISTFSPELLGMNSKDYGDFIFGNIHTDEIKSILSTDKFIKIKKDIDLGVEMCKNKCGYFNVCRGGAPSNKYHENGTFVSDETIFCKLKYQALTDLVISKVEEKLAL